MGIGEFLLIVLILLLAIIGLGVLITIFLYWLFGGEDNE